MKILAFGLAFYLLLITPAGHAEEIADGPYLAMGEVVGTMAACALLPPGDEPDKGSHCFAGLSLSFLGTIVSQNMESKSWAGAIAGCAGGALKEIYDHNNEGTVELADFAWTCVPAITTNIGLNGIISFYNNKVEVKYEW